MITRRFLVLALPLLPGAALAAEPRPRREPTRAQQAQQARMRGCNADAKSRNLSADARKDFMRQCLRGSAPTAGTQPG